MTVCREYGITKNIHTDGAANFISTEFDQWCQDYSVNHIISSLYHPASNGKVESAMKIIKAMLEKSTGE